MIFQKRTLGISITGTQHLVEKFRENSVIEAPKSTRNFKRAGHILK